MDTMPYITQEEINKEFPKIIQDLDNEIVRVKTWANENGYHVGTAVYAAVKRYRNELRELRKTLQINID